MNGGDSLNDVELASVELCGDAPQGTVCLSVWARKSSAGLACTVRASTAFNLGKCLQFAVLD